MKKVALVICISISALVSTYAQDSVKDNKLLYDRFVDYYNTGDLINAEKALTLFVESKFPLSTNQLIAGYNNLGVICLSLGNYEKALEYNYKAEALLSIKDKFSPESADIFNNRGRIYNIKKSYDIAIVYLEKSIRIYQYLGSTDKSVLNSLSSAFINISVALIETKKYSEALTYLNSNVKLNSKFKLSGLPLTYLNLAKTYVRTGDSKKAEEYYLKSILSFINEYNKDYYRLAEVYFDYGLLLRSEGRIDDALAVHRKSLYISLKNYGKKNTLVSLSYKHIADDYLKQSKLDSSLLYYQKSLIAVSKTFDNNDIFSNPSIDSSLFDIRLLDNLKSKAYALELLACKRNDLQIKLKILNKSHETINIALEIVDRIRNNYMSEESRIYLAENEKETYLFATHLAYSLYSLTHGTSMAYEMYGTAQKAKAAILRNEIAGNEFLYSRGIPDSLLEKQKNLALTISAYNNLVIEELRETKPDGTKISLWKDALFDMNREKEKVTSDIERMFPQYRDLLRKTEPDSLAKIQSNLKKGETIVDYLLSNHYTEGKRKLYIFLISSRNLNFLELSLDSVFEKDAELILKTADPSVRSTTPGVNFVNYTNALNDMYLWLIKPIESIIKGKDLIIIPDEEIGWLPFDAFLKNKPPDSQKDFDGLHFMIQDYTFSYGYSSSLIFSKKNIYKKDAKVYAFSPDYSGHGFSSLKGAGTEIGFIFKWFKGKSFIGENATKANFLALLNDSAIFHLAMHSLPDSTNSRYSFLMFDSHLSGKDTCLYNYEISRARIKSPMVVLSACNSGTGTLYYGEGLMSLARGFTIAGASSVIKTAWEINDEASASIINSFYYHLSKGKPKNEAMRLAKLGYLEKATPSYADPYFWAAYEVLGDNTPVAFIRTGSYIVFGLPGILTVAILIFYLKRRRIVSERSL